MLVLRPTRHENFIARILAKGEKLSRGMIEDLLREVAEERDLLQVIFNSMAEGVVAASEDGTGVLVNRAACHLLGLRQEEILGNPIQDVVPEGGLRDRIRECLRERSRILWEEVHVSAPVDRILLLTVIPMQDRSERHKGIVALFFDVTERKITEEGLKQAQKLADMTTLSARVSHELRNPLNNLQIYTQLAERELREIRDAGPNSREHGETAAGQLKVVREEIQRLNDILEGFLVAVRPSRPLLDEVDVRALVESVIRVMDPELRKRGIRANLDLRKERIPPILADEAQLRFAIRNLIQNALEAIGEEGEITIGIDIERNHLVLSVADTGPGIPEEIQEQIFEPYFSTKAKGTGLGLVTVRRVAEDHGGEVTVRSAPGEGSEFVLRIPRRRDRTRLLSHEPRRKPGNAAPAAPVGAPRGANPSGDAES